VLDLKLHADFQHLSAGYIKVRAGLLRIATHHGEHCLAPAGHAALTGRGDDCLVARKVGHLREITGRDLTACYRHLQAFGHIGFFLVPISPNTIPMHASAAGAKARRSLNAGLVVDMIVTKSFLNEIVGYRLAIREARSHSNISVADIVTHSSSSGRCRRPAKQLHGALAENFRSARARMPHGERALEQ
jgi:hypothetical protein